jgi:hypothetical protein
MITGPHKPWAVPEEDNMSIGELAEWLQQLPEGIQHLPVKLVWEGQTFSLNPKRMDISDGNRYFSVGVLEGMKTFNGLHLEINADSNY